MNTKINLIHMSDTSFEIVFPIGISIQYRNIFTLKANGMKK